MNRRKKTKKAKTWWDNLSEKERSAVGQKAARTRRRNAAIAAKGEGQALPETAPVQDLVTTVTADATNEAVLLAILHKLKEVERRLADRPTIAEFEKMIINSKDLPSNGKASEPKAIVPPPAKSALEQAMADLNMAPRPAIKHRRKGVA